jgi:hypothetical protein
VRRRFEPVVPIHCRDVWKCSARGPVLPPPVADAPEEEEEEVEEGDELPEAADPYDDEDGDDDDTPGAPGSEPVAPDTMGAVLLVVVVTGTVTTGGGGGFGAGGSGTGTGTGGGAGTVTVGTVGTGGRGTVSALATPQSTPRPASRRTAAKTLIQQQLAKAPNGCAHRRIGKNQGKWPF